MKPAQSDRRSFLKTTSTLAASAAALGSVSAPAPASAADGNSRIRIGFIGPGGRGFGAHVKYFVQLRRTGAKSIWLALLKSTKTQRNKVADLHQRKNGLPVPELCRLPRHDRQGKSRRRRIGTPDHWHATADDRLAEAGLDVYCEKPMTKSVEEALRRRETRGRRPAASCKSACSRPACRCGTKSAVCCRTASSAKSLDYQTEYFRNSAQGQWRYYKLEHS